MKCLEGGVKMWQWPFHIEYSETKIDLKENTKKFIEMFSEFVEEANNESIRKTIKFLTNSIQGELMVKSFYNNRNYREYTRSITASLLLDLQNEEFQECDRILDAAQTPIISCIWDINRIKDNICSIGSCNDNLFDGEKYSWNIEAYLIEPLGLVIVENGNHSVNAALVHGEGKIIAKNKIDISPCLERYQFNGEDYINIGTGEKIKCPYLIQNSKPFTYILGLLFEIARILKEKQSDKYNKLINFPTSKTGINS